MMKESMTLNRSFWLVSLKKSNRTGQGGAATTVEIKGVTETKQFVCGLLIVVLI